MLVCLILGPSSASPRLRMGTPPHSKQLERGQLRITNKEPWTMRNQMKMSHNKEERCWKGTDQDKTVPSTRFCTRRVVASNGATSTGAMSTQQEPPPDQHSPGPGLQQPARQRTKRNLRQYNSVKWSIEEKKIILFCFAYSRYEGWGRLKSRVFEDEIRKADLPPEKIAATTMRLLTSIVSQIRKYLPEDEIENIKREAESKAKNDYEKSEASQQQEYRKSIWNREEEWVLIWAMEYAKEKYARQGERCREWQRIFHHHCPNKIGIPRAKLTTQKSNFIAHKHFTEGEIAKMREEIRKMIKDNKCPIEEPLGLPSNNSVVTAAQDQHRPPPPTPQSTTPPRQVRHDRKHQERAARMTSPEPPGSPSSSSSSDTEDPGSPDSGNGSHTPSRQPSNTQTELDPEQRELEEELTNKIEEARGMPMEERPKLIKLKENKEFKALVRRVNTGLARLVPAGINLTEINHTNYGAAWYIQGKIVPDYKEKRGIQPKNRHVEPLWKKKIQDKINQLRAEISQMTCYMQKQNHSDRLLQKIKKIKRKYRTDDKRMSGKIAEHQAKVKALAAQVRNREQKIKAKKINKQFAANPRSVYRDMTNETVEVRTPPSKEDLERFWRPLFEDPRQHQENSWIDNIRHKNSQKQQMPPVRFTTEKVTKKITEYSNFKAPGTDKIPNFWLKKITALHSNYAQAFSRIVRGEEESPEWLTKGNTILLPKSPETQLPNKYRPICCLPTTYKWLTGVIADEIYEHLDQGNYMEKEQKGCVRNKLGTKDQLLINKTILEDCKKRQRNLSMAWIDYKKAFDSVPHTWILKCLELYNISEEIRSFLAAQMVKWKTTICLNHSEGQIVIPDVKIQRGIFQGDSLSPLLFCLTIDPLSKILNDINIGYDLSRGRSRKENKKVNHLLFMDDLKLYADSEENMEELVRTVYRFSNNICMEFGLDKCAKSTIRRGKKITSEGIEVEEDKFVEDLAEESAYKYLGIEENANIEHKKMREKIKKEYLSRLKKICKSELTPKNKITAINQLAIPVVTYGFGIVDWPQGELDRMDVKTRKILTLNKVTYKHQCMDRMYLPRREGGLGLVEINQAYRAAIVSIGQYLKSSGDENIKRVAQHHDDALSQLTSITKQAKNFAGDLLEETEGTEQTPATKLAKKTRQKFSQKEEKLRKERWKDHRRAGRFQEELEKNYIEKEESLRWIRNGDLGYDGERLIIGAQDQGLLTNGFKKMAGITENDQCRFCHAAVESVSHLVSACQILLADGYYTTRHNKICRYIHWKICKEYKMEVKEKVWEHEPDPVTSNGTVTIFYDKEIPTGRYIEGGAIKPDILIWDKENKTAKIIEVTVPNDFGLNRAERHKITKYQDLKNDLKSTWALKEIEIIPVVVGATGLMKKSLRQYLQAIPSCPSIHEVQTAAIRGTVTILKRALGYKQG